MPIYNYLTTPITPRPKSQGTVDVTNSFAVPFEEDLRNPNIFFIDHDFLGTMFSMYKKVNARENIVGFYSTGPKVIDWFGSITATICHSSQ